MRWTYMAWRYSIAFAVFGLIATLGSRATYAAPPADPCSLLTASQVGDVLGVSVGPGQKVGGKLCQWSAGGQPAGPNGKKVLLTLQDERAFTYAKMPVGHGITKTPVSGVGDDAVYGTTPGVGTTLAVKKGAAAFVVHVTGFSIDDIKAKEKTLALEVLPKL
jgi:hypothetical protein